MKNRIMLIYPPGKLYQRGEDRAQSNIEDSAAASVHACNDIGYAAAILMKNGYEVFLRDYQTELASFDDVKNDIEKFLPDLILISTTNATIGYDLGFVRSILEFHKTIFVLKGAIFFDSDLSLLKLNDFSDISCMIGGEIDTSIASLADCILKNEGSLSEIPNIIYRDTHGDFCKTDFTCWNDELDSVPFPARELMNNELYVRPDTGEPMATIQVSRGCPSRCVYCLTPIISGTKVRFRSVENVFEEIKECYYKFNIKCFFFKADTFTINKEWAVKLCDLIINSKLLGKISFTVNARADTVSPELLSKLKKAGCFMLAVGFESGSDETLKRIKKGTTVQQNLDAAKMIKKSKIPLFGFFMIGFPWEREQDMKDTMRHMRKINPDFVEIHIAMPYYGTELYTLCKEYKTVSSESWNSDYYSPNTSGTSFVPMEKVQKLRRNELLRFYLRPLYIMKKIGHCFSDYRIFGNYVRYGIRLLKNNLKFGV
ncbi:MAG: radical SAM protein [Ruminococcus sp.]|nr:radical SAM protein [Candidatus Copronaster equi]